MRNVLRGLLLLALVVGVGCDSRGGSGGQREDAVILSGRMISVEIESSEGAFTIDPEDAWYHQTAMEETMAMSVIAIEPGESKYPAVDFVDSMRQTDTEIADRSAGEFYKMRLVREGDRVLMETRQRYMGDFVKESNFEFKGEVEFVEGDWFDYESGGEVAVKYTPEGLRASNEAFVEQIQVAIEPALRAMFLDDLKEYKREEGWEIADSDLGRIVYTESEADFELVANTVYRFDQLNAWYDEDSSTRLRVFLWFGFTTEHLKAG